MRTPCRRSMLSRRADGVATVWSLINAADQAIGERITELTILGQFSQLGDIGKDRFPLSARARMKVEPLDRNRRWRVMMLLHQLHSLSFTGSAKLFSVGLSGATKFRISWYVDAPHPLSRIARCLVADVKGWAYYARKGSYNSILRFLQNCPIESFH